MGGGFVPFRHNVTFLRAREMSILPLISELTFIKDKTHRGAPFRFGTVQIPEEDFRLIAEKVLEDQSLFKSIQTPGIHLWF